MKLDDVSMELSGGLVLAKKPATEQTTQFKKISDTYNEHAKLHFLFDVSGSMSERIAVDKTGSSYSDQFIWPDLDPIRVRISAVQTALINDLPIAPEDSFLLAFIDQFNGSLRFTDDESLKQLAIKHDLTADMNAVPNTLTQEKFQEPPTRLGIVRKLCRQEVHARFAKYPSSRIAISVFSGQAATVFDDGTDDMVDAAVEKLNTHLVVENKTPDGMVKSVTYMDGGTDIMRAMHHGLDVFRAAPSTVGMHHMIIVTDGGAFVNLDDQWITALKASGVVLDYIHIGDEMPNANLVAGCKSLGGDCVVVNDEKSFAEKFKLAANRLMLPPSSK